MVRPLMQRRVIIICLVCCCSVAPLLSPFPCSAQMLQSLRDEVREPDEDKPEEANADSGKKSTISFDGSLWGDVLLLGLAFPYWGPIVMLDDHYAQRGYFACYPYAEGTEGSMMIEPYINSRPYKHILRTSVEYARETDNLSRISSHMLVDTTTRFGLDAQWDYRAEDLQTGGHDGLHSGDFNVVYRFAQDEAAQLRSGLGFNWLSDEVGTDLGFNFTYGGDLFFHKPWITSAEIDWGRLGNAGLFRGRWTIGAVWRSAEIYTGYEYSDVGTVQLDGLISGVRFWY